MKINELFKKLQENFLTEEDNDILSGELNLHGNCIIWEYDLDKDSEEIEVLVDEQDDDFSFNATSSEELLQETYHEDLELIEEFLDKIEELDNWTFSDSETNENVISFKIF